MYKISNYSKALSLEDQLNAMTITSVSDEINGFDAEASRLPQLMAAGIKLQQRQCVYHVLL